MAIDVISGAISAVNQQQATAAFQRRIAAFSAGSAAPAAFNSVMLAKAKSTKPATSARQQAMLSLESTLMSKLVDSMMPKEQPSFYGKGLAGETWRGFAMQQMGGALAKSDLLHFGTSASAARQVNLFAGADNQTLSAE